MKKGQLLHFENLHFEKKGRGKSADRGVACSKSAGSVQKGRGLPQGFEEDFVLGFVVRAPSSDTPYYTRAHCLT